MFPTNCCNFAEIVSQKNEQIYGNKGKCNARTNFTVTVTKFVFFHDRDTYHIETIQLLKSKVAFSTKNISTHLCIQKFNLLSLDN